MEGDPRLLLFGVLLCYFYPRPHMEGDPTAQPLLLQLRDFYPRPHMEGDLPPE